MSVNIIITPTNQDLQIEDSMHPPMFICPKSPTAILPNCAEENAIQLNKNELAKEFNLKRKSKRKKKR